MDLLLYRTWFITYCCLYNKMTCQQIYGMPTGSVIVWLDNLLSLGHLKARFHDTRLFADFGLSYPRISLVCGCKYNAFFLILPLGFAAFRQEKNFLRRFFKKQCSKFVSFIKNDYFCHVVWERTTTLRRAIKLWPVCESGKFKYAGEKSERLLFLQ